MPHVEGRILEMAKPVIEGVHVLNSVKPCISASMLMISTLRIYALGHAKCTFLNGSVYRHVIVAFHASLVRHSGGLQDGRTTREIVQVGT